MDTEISEILAGQKQLEIKFESVSIFDWHLYSVMYHGLNMET